MNLLFLSHCVPNPPDKGERIRAYHELRYLARAHSVHVVCFGRSEAERRHALELQKSCASVYMEVLPAKANLARAALRFAGGGCLTTSYYFSRRMLSYVSRLRGLDAAVVYSSAMTSYLPPRLPYLLDLVDVDSEKWKQYAATRWPRAAYRVECGRLRAVEKDYAARAGCTLLATAGEVELLHSFAPEAGALAMENGVDFDYFDPEQAPPAPELEGRNIVSFVGAMDYFPNSEGACWFADHVYPQLRAAQPGLEFFIVGRDPTAAVQRLASRTGITVTGAVPDVRPFLAASRAVAAPLQIARGIQNKVLEALAMGKRVYATEAIARTFGKQVPHGLTVSPSDEAMRTALLESMPADTRPDPAIRAAAMERFLWERNLGVMAAEIGKLAPSALYAHS